MADSLLVLTPGIQSYEDSHPGRHHQLTCVCRERFYPELYASKWLTRKSIGLLVEAFKAVSGEVLEYYPTDGGFDLFWTKEAPIQFELSADRTHIVVYIPDDDSDTLTFEDRLQETLDFVEAVKKALDELNVAARQ